MTEVIKSQAMSRMEKPQGSHVYFFMQGPNGPSKSRWLARQTGHQWSIMHELYKSQAGGLNVNAPQSRSIPNAETHPVLHGLLVAGSDFESPLASQAAEPWPSQPPMGDEFTKSAAMFPVATHLICSASYRRIRCWFVIGELKGCRDKRIASRALWAGYDCGYMQ